MAQVLRSLDAPLLAEHSCWFGGGTAIVLAHDEYRESVDIDLLGSDVPSYRALRQIVRDHGLHGLAHRRLDVARTPSIDGYGIRAAVVVDRVLVKVEIILEGRIFLDVPSPDDAVSGVRVLTRTDQVASLLLANDDRWADTSTFSRDLIDLAMMKPEAAIVQAGATKANEAYGRSVGESLGKAVAHLRERPQRLDKCIRALKMDATRAEVWQSIRDLAARCATVGVLDPARERATDDDA